MTRAELIDGILWTIPAVLYTDPLMLAVIQPVVLKSIVLVLGDPASYTDEELQTLHDFSLQKTMEHMQRYTCVSTRDNVIVVEKFGDGWRAKRMSCTRPSFQPTLEAAIALFPNRPSGTENRSGDLRQGRPASAATAV